MNITYFIDNKLGGVSSLNYNLTANPIPGSYQCVIHLDLEESKMAKADIHYPVDKEIHFHYSSNENYHQTLKRLRKLVPDEEGALVLNYNNEMSMLDHYPVKQTTYQLVHDQYNLRLAEEYGHVVDVFICHNTAIQQGLLKLFPHRNKDIFYMKHGVPVPANTRKYDKERRTLRLLFLGRMVASKGIYDLLLINDILRERNIDFEWVCIGNGPELDELKNKWNKKDKVRFISPQTNKEVIDVCIEQDVFVLPTKFEGTPVSLLETMSAGVVPVISQLEGSIPEIVTKDIGYCLPVNDNAAFANAIIELYHDRELLKRLSMHCREKIIETYEIKKTATLYHELFARYQSFYKTKTIQKKKVGAKLDQRYIPERLTKLLRKLK